MKSEISLLKGKIEELTQPVTHEIEMVQENEERVKILSVEVLPPTQQQQTSAANSQVDPETALNSLMILDDNTRTYSEQQQQSDVVDTCGICKTKIEGKLVSHE